MWLQGYCFSGCLLIVCYDVSPDNFNLNYLPFCIIIGFFWTAFDVRVITRKTCAFAIFICYFYEVKNRII